MKKHLSIMLKCFFSVIFALRRVILYAMIGGFFPAREGLLPFFRSAFSANQRFKSAVQHRAQCF